MLIVMIAPYPGAFAHKAKLRYFVESQRSQSKKAEKPGATVQPQYVQTLERRKWSKSPRLPSETLVYQGITGR
jgi:hypothetical protein